MSELTASVGLGGRNLRHDVERVQRLLTSAGFSPGAIDGRFGPRTAAAILSYQSQFLTRPDGRIDPGGRTWRRLSGHNIGGTQSTPQRTPPTHPSAQSAPANALQNILRTVERPDPAGLNPGLTPVNNRYLIDNLGQPRDDYGQDCRPVTNPRLRELIYDTPVSVGPFNVRGLRLAVDSLREVMRDIQREQPEVYAALGSAGMLCARYVRGSTTSISNHSWGTAIDLTLGGRLDNYGDGRVQVGLLLIAPIFNRHGWYWGAAFRKEDAMHFEVSRNLMDRWLPSL